MLSPFKSSTYTERSSRVCIMFRVNRGWGCGRGFLRPSCPNRSSYNNIMYEKICLRIWFQPFNVCCSFKRIQKPQLTAITKITQKLFYGSNTGGGGESFWASPIQIDLHIMYKYVFVRFQPFTVCCSFKGVHNTQLTAITNHSMDLCLWPQVIRPIDCTIFNLHWQKLL